MEDEDFEIIETDELIEGPGDDFEEVEEVEGDYKTFKDGDKAYKVSKETEQLFLKDHPYAESIPDGGPYQYDETYLYESDPINPDKRQINQIGNDFEIIDSGPDAFDLDNIERVLEQNKKRDADLFAQEDDYIKWKEDKGYLETEDDEDSEDDLYRQLEAPMLPGSLEVVTPVQHQQIQENIYLDQYLKDKKDKVKKEHSDTYGVEYTNAVEKGFVNPVFMSKSEIEQFDEETPYSYDIWQPENETVSNPYFNSSNYTELGFRGGQPMENIPKNQAEVESDWNMWLGREGERIYNTDVKDLTNTLALEYTRDGYKITDGKSFYPTPLKTITREQLEAEAREKINGDREYVTSQYASNDMNNLKKLQQEYVSVSTLKGPGSPEAIALKKQYESQWEKVMNSDGAEQLYNPITEEFLKDRPERKEQINVEAKELAETTPIQTLTDEHMHLYYRLVAMNNVMTEGNGYRRVWGDKDRSEMGVTERIAASFDGLQEGYLMLQESIGDKGDLGEKAKGRGLTYDPITGNKVNLSMNEDVQRMFLNKKEGVPGNRMPYPGTPLQNNSRFNEFYNEQLLRFITIGKALEYNYNPSTLEQTGFADHFIMGAVDILAEDASPFLQGGDKEAKRWVEGMEFLRGKEGVTEEEVERAKDRTRDLISGGVPEFMLLMGIMATTKTPVAGGLTRITALGEQIFGRTLVGETLGTASRGFQKIALESVGAPAAVVEGAGTAFGTSPALSLTAEMVTNGIVEVGAGYAADKTLGALGGEEMGWSIWAGFGAANPISKRLINKILTPVMMGETKGLLNWKNAYRNNEGFKAIVDGTVSSTTALPTTVAVELFDATFIDTDNPDKTLAHITDPEKLFILWSQIMLTGGFSSRSEYATGLRKFGSGLNDAIMGYPLNSPQANAAAKRLGIRSTRKTNGELNDIHVAKEQELLNDPKYADQQKDGLALEGTELATKLEELNTDLKSIMFHNELLTIQKQIGKIQDPNGVYQQKQKQGRDLLESIVEQSMQLKEGESLSTENITLTPENIDYLANTPQTLIDMALSGPVRSSENIEMSAKLKALKQKAQQYQQKMDGMGFKKNTTQYKEALEIIEESTRLENEAKELQKERQGNVLPPVLVDNAIKKNKARQKELSEILEAKEIENQGYLETARLEDIRIAEEQAKKYYPESEFKTFETTEDYLAKAKELGVDAKGSEGFFIDKGTGKVFIDLQRAREINNITVGTHEVLHQLMEPQLRDAKVTDRLVEEFKKELSWEQLQAVEGKMAKQAEGNRTSKEWFNAFNDAIRDGDIPPPTAKTDGIWKKIGNPILNVLKRGGARNAEFKTGKDVYNFIADYASGKEVAKVKEIKSQPETGKMAASRTKEIATELKNLVPEWKKAEGPEKVKLQEQMKELTAEKKSLEQANNKRVADFKNLSNRFKDLSPKGKEKTINELVEKDGKRLTNSEWQEFLYTDLKDHGGKGLILDKVVDMFEGAIEGKIKGKSVTGGTGENKNTVSRAEAMEILRDELTSRKFQWDKIINFDPAVNKSFSGYMNSIIHNAYKSTLDKIGKKPKSKSLDETYDGGKNVMEAESKDLSPEEAADRALAAEAAEKAQAKKEQQLKDKGASAKAIEEAGGRSTMKTSIDLSKPEQTKVKEFAEEVIQKEIDNLAKEDFTFFEKPKFRKEVIKNFGKEFLEKIPHPSQQSVKESKKGKTPKEIKEINDKAKADYEKWLKEKLYPEVVKRNKPIKEGGDPSIFRRMNWDIMYEPTGKKYTSKEAKAIQVEQGIKNVKSQRAEYREKTPTAEQFVDYILHRGEFKNAKSRPNEKRLRIGDFLAESILGDATVDVIKNSKNISEFQKSELLRDNSLSRVAEILKKDPKISFTKTVETAIKDNVGVDGLEKILDLNDSKVRKGLEEINRVVRSQEIKLYAEENGLKDLALAEKMFEADGKSWKKVIVDNGGEYIPPRERLYAENIDKHKEVSNGIVDALERRFGDLNNPELKSIRSALMPTLGFGNLVTPFMRVNSKGKVSQRVLASEMFITPKEKANKTKVSSMEVVNRFLGREPYSKPLTTQQKKNIAKAKNAWQPAWTQAGFKGKAEILMDKLNKGEITKSEFVDGARKLLTNPKLRNEPNGYEKTMEANDIVKDMFYEGLNDYYNSFKTKEGRSNAEQQIAMLLQNQTNAATGLNKGFFPMESVTTRPEAKSKDSKVLTHNEHMTDLRPANQMVLELIKNTKGNKKAFTEGLKFISRDLKQGLISKKAQTLKDATERGGAGTLSSKDYLLNTFLSNKTAGEQIFLGGENKAKTVAEVLQEKYSRKYLLDKLTSIPESKRTVDVVKLIQQLEYKSNFDKAFAHNESSLPQFSKTRDPKNIKQQVEAMTITDKALELGRKLDKKPKKARVFDFDDTVARTNSNVLYTMPDGRKGKITPAEFAKKGEAMEAQGAKWDFSEFNQVVDGKKGPLFDVMKKMKEAAGERDMFILTARAPEAAPAIHKFLKEMGIDIPIENVKGLGNSSPNAKAEFIVEKAAEGFNDFYFADDHTGNVKAVKDVLDQLDVKSKVQQAKFSKTLDKQFNELIEQTTGLEWFKDFSKAKGEVIGRKKGRGKFFIPPSAEDFLGLTYATLAKGKLGERQQKWYKENVFDPYSRAMDNLSTDRVNLMNDFKQLKKELDVPKDLRKTNETGFTNEQAVRVYLWDKTGQRIPGISKTDLIELKRVVERDSKLQAFADQILDVTKGDGYSTPKENWLASTITGDLIDLLNTTKRGKYLAEWKENIDVIYSEKNLNKLESLYGPKYREALENIITRMKAGKNRIQSGNRLSDGVLNYINQSQGAIMFLNMRSALLQTISATNYMNWSFNNPVKAGKAFANQKQYWKDFVDIMNSDYLVDRRNGLKLNIAENEIADAAKTSKNKAKAVLNYIIEKGYLPTKFADSFAIASGGATFYRNRVNDLIKKEGKTRAEAEKQAFTEFKEISELSQQSSDPSKISQQQSGDLGRIVLQFVNTPMQYSRLQKRAFQDLVKGRGDWKSHISRILYYGGMQNLWFNVMQQGAFALGFGDASDEEEEKMYNNIYNGMSDSILRGLGMGGMTVSVLKNTFLDIYERSGRKRPEYSKAWEELLGFSPAIKRKLTHFKGAAWPFDSKKRRKEVFEKGFSLDNPAWRSLAKVIEGATALPADRLFQKVENIEAALREDQEVWKSIALFMGWPEWQIDKEGADAAKGKTPNTNKNKSSSKAKSGEVENVDYYMKNGKKIYF